MRISNEIREWCKWCDEHSAARDELCKLTAWRMTNMKPTSEERREIAARLRTLAHDNQGLLGAVRMQYVVEVGTRILGTAGLPDCAHVFMRYADLIDPTCRNKQIAYNRTAPLEFRTDNFICSACGETFCADGDGVNHPIDWAYCPNCGARVTGVDA